MELKRRWRWILLLCIPWILAGCRIQKLDTGKVRDLDYTVMDETEIPEEMREQIERAKERPFLYTYADKGDLYIARGYGLQETGGYKILVSELYESRNAIICRTTLMGPEPDEKVTDQPSGPYLVIRTAYSDKYVIAK